MSKQLIRIFTCTLLSAYFLTGIQSGQSQRRADQANKPAEQVLMLSVEGPRPVADAMNILTDRYRWVITYEDPPYVCESDVVDQTVRPDLGLALGPKGGKLEISYSLSPKTGQPEDPAALIEWLLDAHAARGNPGVFRYGGNCNYDTNSNMLYEDGLWKNVNWVKPICT